jgi:hypothetical protein
LNNGFSRFLETHPSKIGLRNLRVRPTFWRLDNFAEKANLTEAMKTSVVNADPQDLTAAEFDKLAEAWRADTRFHSSLSKKFTHWAYLTIMAAGKPVLPLILRDLANRLDHWFYALRYIVRRDVAAGTQSMEDARTAWLQWGRENNYL